VARGVLVPLPLPLLLRKGDHEAEPLPVGEPLPLTVPHPLPELLSEKLALGEPLSVADSDGVL
jgi:hypothetical protein